ncbi:MAG: polymer-forming cytoskeletal protein [Acidobacteria bacterium]|nr:polymer-forming cytoskeletal protein [Acidobacteriota bacterium]MCZ6832220.1 polymer-forming cytoskeletal protein [Acidobacteriota bacterium]
MKLGRHLELSGYIGQGTEIHGTVRFRRLLRVDGILTGRVESYDSLVVGKTGRVDAEVIVGSLQVYGLVKGRIAVDKTIEILPGGRVEGDVYAAAPGVKISEGGVFDGQLHMNPEPGETDQRRRDGETPPGPPQGA